jgi:catechol 2,3-dioxygenase-like lactoylglutathione lyase family enzyme
MSGQPPVEVHSTSAEYRDKVISMMAKKDPSSYPGILSVDEMPLVNCLRYHSIGLAVGNIEESISFYTKLGFDAIDSSELEKALSGVPCKGQDILILKNRIGFELHLIQADKPLEDNQNLLMDFPVHKPPGHTHASWSVCSVPGVKTFMEENGIPLSGTRNTLAIFVRDPDRTTLEFERNDGGDDAPSVFTKDMIGYHSTLDHVGTRIRAPLDRHIHFYAKTFGFNYVVNKYEANPDPLKNMPPWITRTKHACDINFIVNCNSEIPDTGEATENILFADGILRPGIIYPTLEIGQDIHTAFDALKTHGIDVKLDTEFCSDPWGHFPSSAVRVYEDKPTLFVRDLNGNIIRLIATGS